MVVSKNGQMVKIIREPPWGLLSITFPYNFYLSLYIQKNINIIHNEQILKKLIEKWESHQ